MANKNKGVEDYLAEATSAFSSWVSETPDRWRALIAREQEKPSWEENKATTARLLSQPDQEVDPRLLEEAGTSMMGQAMDAVNPMSGALGFIGRSAGRGVANQAFPTRTMGGRKGSPYRESIPQEDQMLARLQTEQRRYDDLNRQATTTLESLRKTSAPVKEPSGLPMSDADLYDLNKIRQAKGERFAEAGDLPEGVTSIGKVKENRLKESKKVKLEIEKRTSRLEAAKTASRFFKDNPLLKKIPKDTIFMTPEGVRAKIISIPFMKVGKEPSYRVELLRGKGEKTTSVVPHSVFAKLRRMGEGPKAVTSPPPPDRAGEVALKLFRSNLKDGDRVAVTRQGKKVSGKIKYTRNLGDKFYTVEITNPQTGKLEEVTKSAKELFLPNGKS